MKRIFILAFCFFASAAWAEDPGYLLIEIGKHTFEQTDELTEVKNNAGSAWFALELDDAFKTQIAPPSEQTPNGVRLKILTMYALGKPRKGIETHSHWMFAFEEDGFLRISGYSHGHEEILGHEILGHNPTTHFNIRVARWEDVAFGSSLNYQHDLSGANLSTHFKFVKADDPILKSAFVIKPQTKPTASNIRHVSGCQAYLGRFAAQAYFE